MSRPPQAAPAALIRVRWARATWYALLLLIALVQLAWIGFQYQRDALVDFNVYYASAAGFRQGLDMYGMGVDFAGANHPEWLALADSLGLREIAPPYRYPPLTAQLTAPLLAFPPRIAGTLWLALSSLAFLLSTALLARTWPQREGPAILAALALTLVPMLTTLHNGQVNAFVLLALSAGFVALANDRPVRAGIAIAVAALLKLLPFALVLYLGWKHAWRAFIAAMLALSVLMLSAPLTLGADILSRYAGNFFHISGHESLYAQATNQALSGWLTRLLEGVLPVATIQQLILASAILLVLATIALCWPRQAPPQHQPTWRAEFGLIVCTLLLIPPYSWYHMLVLALIPISITAEWLWREARYAQLGALAALHGLTALHGLFYHAFENHAWAVSFPMLYVVFLWLSLAGMLRQTRRAV